MDAISDASIHTVVAMWSAQSGKTEGLLNAIGYHIDQDPAPMLMMQPTLEMAEAISTDRVAPMLAACPALRGIVADPRSRDSQNKIRHKKFPGGHLTLCGANSPASMASRPIRIVYCDEVDRYPVSAGTEGDPVSIVWKRATTFFNRKLVLTSTPTIKGASRIELAFQTSDQRYYMVPCPHCGERQRLMWSNVVFDKQDPYRTAHYVCKHCGSRIEETDKAAMLKAGGWEATAESDGIAGFHQSELYSPWKTWGEMAAEFLIAKRDTETLKTWINTSLGETWEDEGVKVEPSELYARREQYPAEVPAGGLVLTAGVDVQDDRLEAHVVAWGVGGERWGVAYRVLWGDPARPDVWSDLDDLLIHGEWKHENGYAMRIAATCVDSGGHHTQEVYKYCEQRRGNRVFAIKGMAGEGRPVAMSPMRRRSGRGRRAVELWIAGVDNAKSLIYSSLQQAEPGFGYFHFPILPEYNEDFFAQLTAEKRITTFTQGIPKRKWIRIRPRNEGLDTTVYSLVALTILNPDYAAITKRIDARQADGGGDKTPKKKAKRRPASNYVNQYRRR